MIPFASQRGGGQDLATHLQNAYDNELTEVAELRGSISSDLHGAFKEWESQAEALTRCRKYLYSLSINPDPAQGELTRAQYSDYIRRAEEALGLTGQPRAVVFHIKHGREHCHVVWSRVDAERGKAVHIAFDRDKLMQVTRAFAREHFLELPRGYEKSRQVGQEFLYERAAQNQTGLSKAEHARNINEAWVESDNAKAFADALAERGYMLARGKRPYVVVDFYGNTHALARLMDDKTVRTRDLRAYLEKDFPSESLPSVEEAEQLIARHRQTSERNYQAEQESTARATLLHAQKIRQDGLAAEAAVITLRHVQARDDLISKCRDERHTLRRAHTARMKTLRQQRSEFQMTGLAGFLGRVTGVNAIRRAVHRFQDSRVLDEQIAQRLALQAKQVDAKKSLAEAHARQLRALQRKAKALQKINNRELAALKRDGLKAKRIQAREGLRAMPPIMKTQQIRVPGELSADFKAAKSKVATKAAELAHEFNAAARERGERGDAETGRGPTPDAGLDRER